MKPRIYGVTGGIASGKSSVLQLLRRAGWATISSDALAHRAIRKGQPAYKRIVHRYGTAILDAKNEIRRKSLGSIVFAKPAERRWLERVIHPVVIRQLKAFAKSKRGNVALDIPLLYEAGLKRLVDRVVVVYSSPAQQLNRLRARNPMSLSEARRRIRSQWPLARKRERADFVVDNTGKRTALHLQVRNLLQKIAQINRT